MARINTNVGALTAQRHLNRSYSDLNQTINRLSSGLRITRGADDPAGLIVSERLRSEISAVNQAITNTKRASVIISTTEGALDEVARLLTDIQDLIVEAANEGALSREEIEANQLQIDDAINSITRIANTTTFAGKQLLNGSLDYISSGVDDTVIDAIQVNSAQFGTRSNIPVNVEVLSAAEPAQLFYPLAAVASDVTIEVGGPFGFETISFAAGTPASRVADAINQVSDATGVVAVLSGGTVRIESRDLGSRQFVSIDVLTPNGNASFPVEDADGVVSRRDTGKDAVALINGARTLGDGNKLKLRTSSLDINLQLDAAFTTGATQFTIVSGGALFQVGPSVNSALQVNIGVQSVAASRLGNSEVGFLSQLKTDGDWAMVKDPTSNGQTAQKILEEAIKQVSVLRGRLGAFERNTLDTNANQLGITAENLQSAESVIRDADFAAETSHLTRAQILVNAGTSVLALAQQTPQTALQLLR